jgi:hypothetical protein
MEKAFTETENIYVVLPSPLICPKMFVENALFILLWGHYTIKVEQNCSLKHSSDEKFKQGTSEKVNKMIFLKKKLIEIVRFCKLAVTKIPNHLVTEKHDQLLVSLNFHQNGVRNLHFPSVYFIEYSAHLHFTILPEYFVHE